mmetsp:Transcript_27848/g.84993  ORF Transcript_27848/g.84993 Transcript_27848/m.84993 type:complete len:329 (-) Transcript_27848:971-1957(-)
MLGMNIGVLIEDDPRVQDECRVEELLYLPHELVGLSAPFHLNERSHVAAGAMLRLEGAAVLDGHVLVDVVHNVFVTLDLLRRLEALVENKVKIAFEGVTHETRVVVAPLAEDGDEILRHLSEFLSRARNVLEQHRCPRLPGSAHDGDKAFARIPKDVVFLRIMAECLLVISDLRGNRHLGVPESYQDLIDGRLKGRLVFAAAFDEESSALTIFGKASDLGAELGELAHALTLRERTTVEDLDGIDGGVRLQCGRGVTCLLNIMEDEESTGLEGQVRHSVVRDTRDESEGALRAHHQSLENFHRVLGREVGQRVDGVPGGVLDAVLLTD